MIQKSEALDKINSYFEKQNKEIIKKIESKIISVVETGGYVVTVNIYEYQNSTYDLKRFLNYNGYDCEIIGSTDYNPHCPLKVQITI